VVAGEEDGDGSAADDLHGRWEGVRRTKKWWRHLTVDEVDGGSAGTARTRAIGSGGAASDRAVRTSRPVGALWRGSVRGSTAAARSARWRWSSNARAPARTAETDRWDPTVELFLN
jgi:hypothetical protein